jgi:hypothetical protein
MILPQMTLRQGFGIFLSLKIFNQKLSKLYINRLSFMADETLEVADHESTYIQERETQ